MPNYCVITEALPTGERIVHRLDKGCSLVPPEKHCLDLGKLADDDEAISEALRRFESIDGCPDCMPGHNDHLSTDAINAAIAAVITVGNM